MATSRSHTAIAGLDLIPSSIALAGAEVELAGLPQRERRLSRLLPPVAAAYDHVFLDCPPSLGLLTVNALTAADAVLVPLQCEYYALEGLSQLIATIHLVRDHLNPGLAVNGVVLTMFDARTNLSAEVAAEVRLHLADAVYDTVVPAQRAPGGGSQPRAPDRRVRTRQPRCRSVSGARDRAPRSAGSVPAVGGAA